MEDIQIPIPLQGLGQDNEIFAQHHSLFIEDKPRTMEPIRDEEGQIVEGVYEEQGGYKVYKLFIGDFNETGNGMQRIINKLQQAEPDDVLEFHIASNGGSVDELVQLYNLVNTMFHDRISTFANHAYSAGAWAFLMGAERVAYEHTSLMLHSYAGGFGGKRQDLLDHMDHEDRRLNAFLMGTLTDYFTPKELKKMNKGKDYWMNAEELCKRGMATHVLKDGTVYTAEEYLELLHPGYIKRMEKIRKEAEKEAKKAAKKEIKRRKDADEFLEMLMKESKEDEKILKEAKAKKVKKAKKESK